MSITLYHLLDALDRVRRGNLGTFKEQSLNRYVIDPRDGEPWDLKAVVGLALELAGEQVSWGKERLTSDNLQRRLHLDLPEIKIVTFQPRQHRRIGLGFHNPGSKDVNWSEAQDEIAGSTATREVAMLRFLRSAHVRQEAEWRAKGTCGDCRKPAPFLTPSGRPFLEVHHILPLGRGGLDVAENVIALCPNCHRKRHHGAGGLDTSKLVSP